MSNNQIRRSDEEWMQLVTECRQSGLSDKAWCAEHHIPESSFYNAISRLRKKACEIPERSESGSYRMDLTAKNQDVVRICLVPDEIPSVPAPAIQPLHLDNSHTIEMTFGGIVFKLTNEADPALVSGILSAMGPLSC